MKWLLVLLLLLGGGVAWAAFAVPTNAAVVNGSAISQASLNSDVHAIAGSAEYQCYLNSEEYLSSNGSQPGLPPVSGAGKGQNEGDNPTANNAFVATYLDTVIGHELVEQLAAKHDVTVDSAQSADARASLTNQITGVMQQVAQTAQGQNPRFSCGATSPLTGQQVLESMPSWFVEEQVQFVATASALQEDLAGVGSSEAKLQSYYEQHRGTVRHGLLQRRRIHRRSIRKGRAGGRGSRDAVRPGDQLRHAERDDPVHRAGRRRRGAGHEHLDTATASPSARRRRPST